MDNISQFTDHEQWMICLERQWRRVIRVVLVIMLALGAYKAWDEINLAEIRQTRNELQIHFISHLSDGGYYEPVTTLEAGTGIVDAKDLIAFYSGHLEIEGTPIIDTSKTGTVRLVYRLSKKTPLGRVAERTVGKDISVVDTIAPLISLRETEVTVDQGDEFDPLVNIASVMDSYEGALNYADSEASSAYWIESNVRTSGLGDYKVTVYARDGAGNTASKSYPVHVVPSWNGVRLSVAQGSVYGPSGRETYYNLDMSGVISAMRYLGFSEQEYPYWIREDGCKMLGDYVMIAANYGLRPKGSLVETSLGTGIVCDTGGFAQTNPTQLDLAVNW